MVQCHAPRYQFSVFTFDTETGELFRSGRKLRIRPQSAQILSILLDRAGTLVTREELRQLLWPNGDFLDHEHAINRAMGELRTILRDDSQSPRFVETIAKKGYRFCAHPQIVDPEPGASPSDTFVETPVGNTHQPRRHRMVAWISIAAALLLAVVAIALLFRHQPPAPSNKPTYLGIAPFQTNSSEAAQVAATFRQELTGNLSNLPGIRVQAANSFISNHQDGAKIRELAKQLDLDVLLFGKFTLSGDRCTLELEMVRGRDASHLAWFRYGGSKGELLLIRRQVQHDILIRLAQTGSEAKQNAGGTTNPRAYEAYLRARDTWAQGDPESLKKALQNFKAAVAEDANFAKAYSSMARLQIAMAEGNLIPLDEGYSQAKELARKALQIDPSQAEAHAALGTISIGQDWDFATGEKELREAINLESAEPSYHLLLSQLLCDQGRFEESFKEIELARAVAPLWPNVYLSEIAVAGSARQHKRAGAAAQKLVALVPDWPMAHAAHGWSLWYSGQYVAAIGEWRRAAVLSNDTARVKLEDRGLRAFQKGGVPAYARVRIEAIESGTTANYAAEDFVPAEWYAYAGEQEKALSALDKMISQHDSSVLQAAVIPAFISLHQNPRFLALLARIGLSLPHSYPK